MKTRRNLMDKWGVLAISMLLIISCAKEDVDVRMQAPDEAEGFERIPSLNVVLPSYVTEENTDKFLSDASISELREYQNAHIIVDYLTQLKKIDTVAEQEQVEILDWNLAQYLDGTQLRELNALLIPASDVSKGPCFRRIYERICETRKTICYKSVPVRYKHPHPWAPRIKYYRRVPYSCYKTTCRNRLIRLEKC